MPGSIRRYRPGGRQAAGSGSVTQFTSGGGGGTEGSAPATPPAEVSSSRPFTRAFSALVELRLASGTRRYSFEGVAVPGEPWFRDRLVDIGTVRRESPIQTGQTRISDTTVSIHDPILLKLKATERFRGREVVIRFGDINNLADVDRIFTGNIVDYRTEDGTITFVVRDATFDRFRLPLSGRFDQVNFPAVPAGDFTPDLLPVIYGTLTSESLWDTGAVPCYRINDSTPFQYLVARHACKEIINVYNYETLMSASAWDAVLVEIDGQMMQCLEFASDPKDADRPNEFEITVDVTGKTYDGTSNGASIDIPSEQLRDYLKQYAGVRHSEFSSADWDAAKYAGSLAHQSTNFDGSTQYLSLASKNVINAENSLGSPGIGDWSNGGNVSISVVNIADEGLPTEGLPPGIATAIKITSDGGGAAAGQVTVPTLSAAKYFFSGYVLSKVGWGGGDITIQGGGYSGASAGTAVTVTPETGRWQRASRDITPAADFTGVGQVLSAATPSSGDAIYVTGYQVVQEASLSGWDRNALLSSGAQDAWVACWIKTPSSIGDEHAISRFPQDDVNSEFSIFTDLASGELRAWISRDGTNANTTIFNGPVVATDTWYFCLIYMKTSTNEAGFYVGTTLEEFSTAFTAGWFQGVTQFTAGTQSDISDNWSGDIGPVMFGSADHGFSSDDIDALVTRLYNGGTPLYYEDFDAEEVVNDSVNLLSDDDSVALESTGNWNTGADAASVERVNIEDEGLTLNGLPGGVSTAFKLTASGTGMALADLTQTLDPERYQMSIWVLPGTGWAGNIVDGSSLINTNFTSRTENSSVDATPDTSEWRQVQIDATIDSGDTTGSLVITATTTPPAGAVLYVTAMQLQRDETGDILMWNPQNPYRHSSSIGLVEMFEMRPSRGGVDFEGRHSGIALTATGSPTSGGNEENTGGEGLRGAAWIGGQDMSHFDVIDSFTNSFMLPFYVLRNGEFSATQLTAKNIFGTVTPLDAIIGELHILDGSFRHLGNKEVAAQFEYSFARDWYRNQWQRLFLQTANTELAALGEGYRLPRTLIYCQDTDTAHKVMATALAVHAENQQFAEFSLPADFHSIDLHEIYALTHYLGIGDGGYSAVPVRVTAIMTNPNPSEAQVSLRVARNTDGTAHLDNHSDSHGDSSHGDGHGDTAHGDSHSDTAHTDTAHSDVHTDASHGDSAHTDSHTDTAHSDTSHNDIHTDTHTDSHTDTHSDGHSDGHLDFQDVVENHWDHTDSSTASGDGEACHFDTVDDQDGHSDEHCDTHGDTAHSDIHTDVSHVDTHGDTAHADTAHADTHSDTSHADTGHTDSHNDTAHADAGHSDSHTDTAHSDTAHSDIAHADTEHGDYHTDTALSHGDHADTTHSDHTDIHHADDVP